MERICTAPDGRLRSDDQWLCAEGLARGIDLATILKCQEVLDLVHLPSVPRNTRLVKGVVEGPFMSIPLMDLRVNLNAARPGQTDRACVLIVDARGTKVGLIVEPGPEA